MQPGFSPEAPASAAPPIAAAAGAPPEPTLPQNEKWRRGKIRADELLAENPDDVDMLLKAAWIEIHGANNTAKGRAHAARAAALQPSNVEALNRLAIAESALGARDAAIALYQKILAKDRKRAGEYHARVYYELTRLSASAAASFEKPIDQALRRGGGPAKDHAKLYASKGAILDRRGDYDAAFDAFSKANQKIDPSYEPLFSARWLQFCRAAFKPEVMAPRWAKGTDDRRMVFVVGLPRSGSTLVSQILSAHPAVAALGERREMASVVDDFFPADLSLGVDTALEQSFAALLTADPQTRLAAAQRYMSEMQWLVQDRSAQRWVDKLPGNIIRCGAISLLLPEARFVITHRDPLDTALSCFSTCFSTPVGFTERLEAFAHQYAVQRELARHWKAVLGERVIEMRYEDVVSDIEGQAKRLIRHIGLDWDPACAAPHENAGAVITASSSQVRQPVNARSIGKWRRYEKHFAALAETIERYETAALRGPVNLRS